MTRKYILSLAAATIGSGLIAVTGAYAFGFGGHHGHHGSGAARACIAVMNPDQRDDLKSIFKGEKGAFLRIIRQRDDGQAGSYSGHPEDRKVIRARYGRETTLSAAKLKLLAGPGRGRSQNLRTLSARN